MNTGPVAIVGESIAGCTAARELRALEYAGDIVMIGADPDWGCARPPLSKLVLRDDGDSPRWELAHLGITEIRQRAVKLKADAHTIVLDDGRTIGYRTSIIATGATARRIADPSQSGELVVRTLRDARALRQRMTTSKSAIVVGAGFLGMEIASECVRRGVAVTVVDIDAPLERLLGAFLSHAITASAVSAGVSVVRTDAPAALSGNPIDGVVLSDGTQLHADMVVSCVGDRPATEWLKGTGLADSHGIEIGADCSTSVPDVFAAGDVTFTRDRGGCPRRNPFWSNAMAQGKVAAASALGRAARCAPSDDHFWTEILGLPIKVVGPLLLDGQPDVIDVSMDDASALLRWVHPDGRTTIVGYGTRTSVAKLRALARTDDEERTS